jgi:acid phosphatase family membrane protein YuiD
MRNRFLTCLFVLLILVVAADGVALIAGKHGEVVNRLHAAIGNPARVDEAKFRGLHHRAGGLVLLLISLYILLVVFNRI